MSSCKATNANPIPTVPGVVERERAAARRLLLEARIVSHPGVEQRDEPTEPMAPTPFVLPIRNPDEE